MAGRVELLAPAGDMECFAFALGFGADAVYLGAREFGMRTSCANFSEDEITRAVWQAHQAGKRVYLTLNTLPTNEEMRRMPGVLLNMKRAGVDAVIVADLGVLRLVREYAPGVDIHFSTQAGIANHVAACMAYELGAKRVILARELTLEQIAEIRKNTPRSLELEVFVHGAMCMSVSGRCLISSYMTGRDANRGSCAQPCRWKYQLMEEKRPGEFFEVGEDAEGSYLLSADDLCTAAFLDEIIEAGATSLKIEGRAKSFYYVASVTAAYRVALDAALQAGPGAYRMPVFTEEELERTSHRPYSPGFYYGKQQATQSPERGDYMRAWQPVGIVYHQENGRVFCVQRGKFSLGEELEVLAPPGRVLRFVPENIMDAEGGLIEATPHTKMLFSVPVPDGWQLPQGSILRKRIPEGAAQGKAKRQDRRRK